MKKISRFLISMVIGSAVLFSSTPNAYSGEVLGDINADGRVGLQEAIYALQVVAGMRPQPSDVTINEFVGIWKGNGTFVAQDETNTHLVTLSLSSEESSLIASIVFDAGSPVNITGTVTNGIFAFVVPNSDPNNADCANWSVLSTATLDESLTTMSLIFNGIFCGTGGGKPGIFSAILAKQPDFTGTYNFSEQYDLNISSGVALHLGSMIFEVTQIDANNLSLQLYGNNPDEGPYSGQLPLVVSGNTATLPAHPYPIPSGNLLELLLLSDGNNMVYTGIGQEHDNLADISLGVANWLKNPDPVTIDAFVGTWNGITYSDPNLHDTTGGFEVLSESGTIAKVDDDTISITIRGEPFLLDVANGRAVLANAPVTSTSAVYHAISIVTDGSGLSWYMVATELNDPADVSVTVGLMTRQ